MSDNYENTMSKRFKDIIETVRAQTDIVKVIGQHIHLDGTHKGKCPFHEDRNPSFVVNATGKFYHCFGCGAGGDVFSFIERFQNVTFIEALKQLAQSVGIPFPNENQEDWNRLEEQRKIEDVLTKTAQFYNQNLSGEAKDYLNNTRGFTDDIISRFMLGFANGGLEQHLTERCGFSADLCIKAGVLRPSGERHSRDFFLNRVIFPNKKRGRVVYMVGRTLGDGEPKYLNLPGKIEFLYNEDALTNREVFVAEGAPDSISACQIGYPAVSLLGTHFNHDFLAKFSRSEKVYLCLDGDLAGRKATLKIGEEIGEKARVIELPDNLDLNDYLKIHPKEEFENLVRSAKDIVRYELSQIPPDTDPTLLPDLLDPILSVLAKMDKTKAEAFLTREIKVRFKLTGPEIGAYRAQINKMNKTEAGLIKAAVTDAEDQAGYTAYFEGLVDLVAYQGEPAFLIKENDDCRIISKVEKEGTMFYPPPSDQIDWLLPRGEEVVRNIQLPQTGNSREIDATLFDDLREYFKQISDLPSPPHYDLLCVWTMHTYLLEAFQYSPYLILFAVPERGKTRTGMGIIHVAYRGVSIESLREASLIRFADRVKGTIFFDVKNLSKKAEQFNSEDILLKRFERGAKVPRVLFPDRGPFQDTVTFEVFGPSLIGTNEGVNEILQTRGLTINMPETEKVFENDITREAGQPLRERLVAFRARHLGEVLPDIPKPGKGRIGDICKGLVQILRLVKPEREQVFLTFIRSLEEKKQIEKADSLEAKILRVIIEQRDQADNGHLSVKDITEGVNRGKSDRSQVSDRTIGRRLTAMGFDRGRTGNGASAILYNADLINKMQASYGLNLTTETPETSETPVSTPNVSEVSDDSEVIKFDN